MRQVSAVQIGVTAIVLIHLREDLQRDGSGGGSAPSATALSDMRCLFERLLRDPAVCAAVRSQLNGGLLEQASPCLPLRRARGHMHV